MKKVKLSKVRRKSILEFLDFLSSSLQMNYNFDLYSSSYYFEIKSELFSTRFKNFEIFEKIIAKFNLVKF